MDRSVSVSYTHLVENNYTGEEMQHIFPGVPESCLAFLIQMANLESLRTAIKLYEIALEMCIRDR